MLGEPVVVLGASGMLGRATREALAARGIRHSAFTRREVDLAALSDLGDRIPAGTGTVINCAAWTNVDAAETHEDEASRVNGHAVGELARHCRSIGAVLVHFSTDYVFDGRAQAPYELNHPRAPLNAYGRSKALGEREIEASGCQYLLIRTSWVYAPWGKNFVRTIVGLAKKRPTLRVVNDQRGRPSSAEQLARTSLALLGVGARGPYHACDAGECTWFEFARAAVAELGLECVVEPCTSAEFPSPAVRPSYSVLDLSATVARIGPLVAWRDSLRDVLARLES